MFLPATRKEMEHLGWNALDVILVTGDAYIDSPHVGVAVIGKLLVAEGFRVGIIAQPSTHGPEDITRLGEPELFWGVTGGCIDSMVANYTPAGKPRRRDDYTPGGRNDRRPDRATIVYANLIRRCFKPCRPIVLGGIEASLRRVAHYDFWQNRLRRSILLDAKADILVYGMGESAVLELAKHLACGEDWQATKGICYMGRIPPPEYLELPSWDEVANDKKAFARLFQLFSGNNDPVTARGMFQRYDSRFLIHNPPQMPLAGEALDRIFALDYERKTHPVFRSQGDVRALDTIRFSITSHRGCYGDCSFCAIAAHQGRGVQWRTPDSIIAE
jgi:uncharacterized radical SAM protein YgiQ